MDSKSPFEYSRRIVLPVSFSQHCNLSGSVFTFFSLLITRALTTSRSERATSSSRAFSGLSPRTSSLLPRLLPDELQFERLFLPLSTRRHAPAAWQPSLPRLQLCSRKLLKICFSVPQAEPRVSCASCVKLRRLVASLRLGRCLECTYLPSPVTLKVHVGFEDLLLVRDTRQMLHASFFLSCTELTCDISRIHVLVTVSVQIADSPSLWFVVLPERSMRAFPGVIKLFFLRRHEVDFVRAIS